MKKESELQNDWISRLENPEQSWIYSMQEYEALQLRNPRNKTKKSSITPKADEIIQQIVDGASLQELGLPMLMHNHVPGAPLPQELLADHCKKMHWGASTDSHARVHRELEV